MSGSVAQDALAEVIARRLSWSSLHWDVKDPDMHRELARAIIAAGYSKPWTRMDEFREAFAAELEANPGVAPGPTALNRRMGLTHCKQNTINGRYTKLRRDLLARAGFVYDHSTRKYRLPPEST